MSDRFDELARAYEEATAPRQRARAVAQGLTFGGADEAEAWLRSNVMGEDYDAALKDIRGKLNDYRGARPWEALGYEAGGAALPAIAASIFTGGGSAAASTARLFPTLARLVGTGAASGAAYGGMAAEGGDGPLMDQVSNRALGALTGGAVGAVAGPVGYGVARAASGSVARLTDAARRALGPRAASAVEAEIQRLARESGKSIDEVADGIASGRIMAQQNQTLMLAARALRSQDQGADEILNTSLNRRTPQLRQEAMSNLQSALAPGDDNVTRQAMTSDAARRATESAEYNRVFQSAGLLGDDLTEATGDAIQRVPAARGPIEEINRARTGQAPFFSVADDGAAQFSRPLTLRDAETVRRGVDVTANQRFTSGAGGVGTEIRSVENTLRQQLDDAFPELATVRENWSRVASTADAFDEGRKALSRSAEQVEIEYTNLVAKGNEQAVQAYRAGVMAALKNKGTTGSNASLMGILSNPERKEGIILRTIMPEDQLGAALDRIDNAATSQQASNMILGGSQTAPTTGRMAQIGADGIGSDVLDATQGSLPAMLRLAGQALKMTNPGLSPKQVQQVARLMVEENPDAFRRALTDTTAADLLPALAQSTARRLSDGGMASGVSVGQQGVQATGLLAP